MNVWLPEPLDDGECGTEDFPLGDSGIWQVTGPACSTVIENCFPWRDSEVLVRGDRRGYAPYNTLVGWL
jgi:hypothetical protein